MNALEYVRKITQNGSRCRFPSEKSKEVKVIEGSSPFQKFETKLYRTEPDEDDGIKLENTLLERVTVTALNSTTPQAFYDHVCLILPKKVGKVSIERGEYDEEKWKPLLQELTLEISNELAALAFKERNFNGSQTIIKMLQARIKSWQKAVVAEVGAEKDEDDGHIQLNINIV